MDDFYQDPYSNDVPPADTQVADQQQVSPEASTTEWWLAAQQPAILQGQSDPNTPPVTDTGGFNFAPYQGPWQDGQWQASAQPSPQLSPAGKGPGWDWGQIAKTAIVKTNPFLNAADQGLQTMKGLTSWLAPDAAQGFEAPDTRLGQAQRTWNDQSAGLVDNVGAASTLAGEAARQTIGFDPQTLSKDLSERAVGSLPDWANPVNDWNKAYDTVINPQSTWLQRGQAVLDSSFSPGTLGLGGIAKRLGTGATDAQVVAPDVGGYVSPYYTQAVDASQEPGKIAGLGLAQLAGIPNPVAAAEKGLGASTDDPNVWATETAKKTLAFSGVDAQKRAAERIAAGEQPDVVTEGLTKPRVGAAADVVQNYETKTHEYMAAQGRLAAARGQSEADATEVAARTVSALGMIPGEARFVSELIGQVVLDPLNLLDLAPALPAKLTRVGAVEEAGRLALEAPGKKELTEALTGLKSVMTPEESQGVFGGALAKIEKAFEYTPATQSRIRTGTAWKQMTTLIQDVENPEDALTLIRAYAGDPQKAAAAVGKFAVGMEAEIARPVLQQALPELEKAAGAWTNAAGEFNQAEFIKSVVPILETASDKLSGFDPKAKLAPLARAAQVAKGWMSEFYLGTMGYALRNMVSDTSIAVNDGLRMYEDMSVVRRDLEKFGVPTRRLSEGLERGASASGLLEGEGSKLTNVPIIGAIQNKIKGFAAGQEEVRYQRAYHSALRQVWDVNWAPQLSAAEYAGLGEELGNAVEGAARGAMSGKDLRRSVLTAMSGSSAGERFSVGQFVERLSDLSTKHAARLEEEVAAVAKRGGTAEEARAVVQKYADELVNDKALKLVDLGPILKPSKAGLTEFELDKAEVMQRLDRVLARQIQHGDLTKEAAAVIKQQEVSAWSERTVALADARKKIAEAFAGGPHPSPQLSRAGEVAGGGGEALVDLLGHIEQRTSELMEPVRAANDAEYRKLMRNHASRAEWDGYRATSDARWQKVNEDTVAEFAKAEELIRQAHASPEQTGELLRRAGVSTLDEQMKSILEARQGRTAGKEASRSLMAEALRTGPSGTAELPAEQLAEAKFAEMIQGKRGEMDAARMEAMRNAQQTLRANPELGQDVLGKLWSAKASVDHQGEIVLGTKQRLLAAKDAGAITFEKYTQLMAEEWNRYFAHVERIYGQEVPARLLGLETGKADIAERLQRAGVKGEELQRLMKGVSDGSTLDEVNGILEGRRSVARTGLSPQPSPAGEGAGASLPRVWSAQKAPATAEEMVAAQDGDVVQALREARRLRDQGEALAGGINLMGNSKQVGLKRDAKAATEAMDQWGKIVTELEARAGHASGMDAVEAGERAFIRQHVHSEGVATAGDTVRNLSSEAGHDALRDEFAQILKEKVSAAFDSADTPKQGYEAVSKLLTDARFGEFNEPGDNNAFEVWRKKTLGERGHIPGLENEGHVDLIRALGKELGVNVSEWLGREKGMAEVVAAARQKDARFVDELLKAGTVKNDGRVKATDWQELKGKFGEGPGSVLGEERRSPGEILKEMGKEPVVRPVAVGADRRAGTPEGASRLAQIDAELKEIQIRRDSGFRWAGNAEDKAAASRGAGMRESALMKERRGLAGESTTSFQRAPKEMGGKAIDVGLGKGADEAARIHGNAQAPDVADLLTATKKQEKAALDKIMAGLTDEHWASGAAADGKQKALAEAVLKRWGMEMNDTRAAAVSMAEARADFSMLDYSKKRNVDGWLNLIAPYQYWATRQGRNFAIRFAEKPQTLLHFLEYKEAMEKQNEQRGYRKRFEGSQEIPFAGALMDKVTGTQGNKVMVDPLGLIFAFDKFVSTNWEDTQDSKTTLQQAYDLSANFGMSAAPWIDLPLRYANVLVTAQPGTKEYAQQVAAYGKGSISDILPQTGQLRAVTAAAGIGGPGGVDIERPLRSAVGLPEAARFEGYTTARAIRDMSAEQNQIHGRSFNAQPYLLAEALVADTQDKGWSGMLTSMTSADVAKKFGVPQTDAAAALQIAREGASRAETSRGMQSMASGLAGIRMKDLPGGEQVAYGQQRAERAAGYNPATDIGSRADMQEVRAALPALQVARGQYGTLPGEDASTPMNLYVANERGQINAKFDAMKDAAIRANPADKRGPAAIEAQRAAELAKLPQPPPSPAGEGAVRPVRSVVGANSTEALQIRQNEVLAAVAATAPKVSGFKNATTGAVDYAAYTQAQQRWAAGLQATVRGNTQVQAVVRQAQSEGRGSEVAGFAEALTPDALKSYARRNDTPLEAAQRAYYEQVYTPAQDAYNKLKAQGANLQAAYAQTIGAVGSVNTHDLIGLVEKSYPGRWTPGELAASLDGVNFPTAKEVQTAAQTPAQQVAAQRATALAQIAAGKKEAAAAKKAATAARGSSSRGGGGGGSARAPRPPRPPLPRK